MRALIKQYAYNTSKYAGQWVEIDTTFLCNNQYNTTEEFGNLRIMDGDITKIEDDIRDGLGKCKYCGAIVKRGEEEKHFLEQEKKKDMCDMSNTDCSTCFWKCRKYLGQTEVTHTDTTTEMIDGVATTIQVITKQNRWTPYCSHVEKYGGCTHEECRKHGIEWFTKENTFFLKYPNGIEDFTIQTTLESAWNARWTDSKTIFCNVCYQKMLGSYDLKLHLRADEKTIDYIELRNARKRIVFIYDNTNDCFIVRDGIHGSPSIKKNLLAIGKDYPKCNAIVNKAVRLACKDLYKYNKTN